MVKPNDKNELENNKQNPCKLKEFKGYSL